MARYYSSILDAHLLQPGNPFDKLPETHVVYINYILSVSIGGNPLPKGVLDHQDGNTKR